MRQKLALTKLFWKNADFAKKILFNHGRKRGKNAYDVDGTKTSTIFVIFYKVPSLSLLWNKETLNFTWKCGNLLLFYPNIPWKIINNFLRLPNNEKTSLWKMNMLCGYLCTVCYLCHRVAPKKGKGKVKANEVWKWG